HLSPTPPNLTSPTNNTINLLPTHTTPNTPTTSFNLTLKPFPHKYPLPTSSTPPNPLTIPNISNNPTLSQPHQTTIINSLTFTQTLPNRTYPTPTANQIT
ncbi:hypothetical protein, partial [Staphylococcus aureus]|uniref:hypothetical protein n=1 Tax=Staphylococcus aureus TaxID=1280 RepID=UPI001C92EC01